MRRMKISSVAVLATLCATSASVQAQTTYTNRAAFDIANPGLALENFEEATLVNGTAVTAPLDKNSNNVNFTPGQIKDGIRFTTVGSSPNEFFINNSYGGSFNTTKVATTNYSSNLADILFYNNNVTAFGFDLYNGLYVINIFDSNNVQIGSGNVDANRGAFFGFSSNQLISHVAFNNTTTFETFDNVEFGGAGVPNSSPVPEPGSVAMLAGFAVTGASFILRRKRSRK